MEDGVLAFESSHKAYTKFMLVWFITPFLFPFAVKQDWPCRSQFANKSNKTFDCTRFYFY